MFEFFGSMFGYLLAFLYQLINNYGLAIILFTVIIKIVLLPLSIKQQRTMKKSVELQEKMKIIQFKYKNNPEKLNQETMELYKNENMSPFSGCFSAIAQIILLFAVFYLVRSPLTYMKKVDAEVINKYTKISKEYELSTNSAYPEIEIIRELDNLREFVNTENVEESEENKTNLTEISEEELDSMYINMDFLGLNLAQVPTQSSDWKAYIIPILYVLIAVISMKITNPTSAKKQETVTIENSEEKSLTKSEEDFNPIDQMNKNMNMMFPVMYLAVALIAPLGLALYWLMNSLLMIVERLTLNKLLKDEEEN